jgi:FAD-dependent urate hydroxylase
MNSALTALEVQVCADLARTVHPDAKWLVPRQAPDGGPALDVLMVGPGRSGLAFQAYDVPQAVVEP